VSSSELNQPPELLGAMKVTGSGGGFRYGGLVAMEDDTDFLATDASGTEFDLREEGRDYAVARVLYENSADGASRGVGVMSTIATHPLRRATTHGFDTHYQTPSGKWQWDSQIFVSDIVTKSPDTRREGGGGFIDVRYSPRKGRNHLLSLDYYDREVNINDLGQFRRNDVMGAKYTVQQRTSAINFGRDAYIEATAHYEENTARQAVRAILFANGYVIRDNLTEWRFSANALPSRFEDRNSFGNGVYRIDERGSAGLGYSTDTSKRLAVLFDVRYEVEELGGHFWSEQAALVWRPLDRMITDLTLYRRDRQGWLLHEGGQSKRMLTFDAQEWNVKFNLDYFFNARHHFRASLQWVGIKAFEDNVYQIPANPGDLVPTTKVPGEPADDFDISTVNFQLRYRWEIAPMSDLFLVYTKNGNRRGPPIYDFASMFTDVYKDPIAEQLVLKLRYRFGS
jgi:hypothetical protein